MRKTAEPLSRPAPGAGRTLTPSAPPALGVLAAAWGLGGFGVLLGYACLRLSAIALDSFALPWDWRHHAALWLNLVFMAYSEGYRGFQRSYSPRVAARACHLLWQATPAKALVAPLMLMGFCYAPRRRIVGAWLLTLAIIGVVLVYRSLPQPWRGILDAGVVLGLAWGLAATLAWFYVIATGRASHDPELA